MENTEIGQKLCRSCQTPVLSSTRFCTSCGEMQDGELRGSSALKWDALKQAALFFGIELLLCLIAFMVKEPTAATSLLFDVLMAVLVLVFVWSDWAAIRPLLTWTDFPVWKLVLVVSAAILGAVLVQFIVIPLNRGLFNKEFSYYLIFNTHVYGKYLFYLSTALFPAVFEELAFRGYLMQQLLKAFDRKEAIYISAVLFFLIHFSLIAFFWLLPFGVLLAYLRMRENTLWYGMFFHFFFNLTVCVMEVYGFDRIF